MALIWFDEAEEVSASDWTKLKPRILDKRGQWLLLPKQRKRGSMFGFVTRRRIAFLEDEVSTLQVDVMNLQEEIKRLKCSHEKWDIKSLYNKHVKFCSECHSTLARTSDAKVYFGWRKELINKEASMFGCKLVDKKKKK